MAAVSVQVGVFAPPCDTNFIYTIQCTDAEYTHISEVVESFNSDGTHIEATGLMARILQIEEEVMGEGQRGVWFIIENGGLCLGLECEVMPDVSSLDKLGEDFQVTVEVERDNWY